MSPRFAAFSVLMLAFALRADEPTLVVIDAAGKEISPKKWKIVTGTRRLPWVDGKPEAFEVRELGSTSFKDGIITLVPLARVQEVAWDYEKETMTVRVAGLEKPLVGTTKYKDINVLTIEAEVEQGKSGVADLRFRGGPAKGGIRGVKFPSTNSPNKVPEPGPDFEFTVPAEGKSKAGPAVHQVHGIQALYRQSGVEKPLSYVMFKKTLKVEIADIVKISVGTFNVKEQTAECELKQKEGSELSVTLLTSIMVEGKPATLLGFVGQVPAGYRLFPIHTFSLLEKK